MSYIKRIKYKDPSPYAYTKVTTTGDMVEVKSCQIAPHDMPFIKISKDEYVMKDTGEVLQFNHSDNRSACSKSLARSFRELRYIINANVTEASISADLIRWCTLTYNHPVTDPTVLYEDVRRFIQRLRYYCTKHYGNECKFEYIAVAEPQGERADNRWHIHLILIFDDKAPYIKNDDFAKIWANGFTKIESLKGSRIHNLASYLTAYLSDVPIDASDEALSERGKGSKAVIKGARLMLYPPGMNLYRTSRGIKRPTVETMKRYEAEERLEGAKLIARKAIAIEEPNESGQENLCQVLAYHYYDNSPSAREEVRKQDEWWDNSNDKQEMYYEQLRYEAKLYSVDDEYLYLTDAVVPTEARYTKIDELYDRFFNEEKHMERRKLQVKLDRLYKKGR